MIFKIIIFLKFISDVITFIWQPESFNSKILEYRGSKPNVSDEKEGLK